MTSTNNRESLPCLYSRDCSHCWPYRFRNWNIRSY